MGGTHRFQSAAVAVTYALLVGVIYGIPHVWLWRDAGAGWAFPHFNVPDERGAYAGRLRALYDGEELGADVQSGMCPGAPSDFSTTGEYLTFAAGRLFGRGIRGCLILADFLFPAVACLGFYLFLRAMGCSVGLARLGPLTFFLLDPLLASKGPLLGLLQALAWVLGRPLIHEWNCAFIYSRLVSPQASLPLLAFAWFSLARAMRGGHVAWCVPAGLLCGLTASTHLAMGLPLLLGIGLLGLDALLRRAPGWGRFPVIAAIAAAVVAPRLAGFHAFFAHPGSQYVVDRHAEASHAWMGWGYLALMALVSGPFFLLFRRRRREAFRFFGLMLLATVLCMNLQVLSGTDFGIIHYYGYSFIPLVWMGTFAGLSRWRTERRERGRAGTPGWGARTAEVVVALYALGNGYAVQAAHYEAPRLRWERPAARWLAYQSLGPVMEWLEAHADREDVVVSSFETSDLYTIYAPTRVLAQFMIQTCPVPTDAYLDRFLLPFKAYGLDWSAVESLADGMVYDIHMLAETWRSRTWARPDHPPRWTKSEIIGCMEERYRRLPDGERLADRLAAAGVRFIVFGTFERELPGASETHLRGPRYVKRFEAGGHSIYELLPGPEASAER